MVRRAIMASGAAAVLLLAGCGAGGSEAASSASSSTLAPYTPGKVAQSAQSAAAASASAAEAAASAAAASSSAAAEAAKRVPTHFSGSGDDVVNITKPPGSTVVIVTVTGNKAGRYFGVKALDGDRDTLVNTTEPYSGTTLMDANIGGTTQLQVTATGPWTITIADLSTAPTFTGTTNGTGDAVLICESTGSVATITGNQSARYFGVKAYGTNSSGGTLVNTTDPYKGTVPWPGGNAFVVVTAVGPWSIAVS